MRVLWWKCHLELNRLSTEANERRRLRPGYGRYELEQRQETVSIAIFYLLGFIPRIYRCMKPELIVYCYSYGIPKLPYVKHSKNGTMHGKRREMF
jgi:hypothetical protein